MFFLFFKVSFNRIVITWKTCHFVEVYPRIDCVPWPIFKIIFFFLTQFIMNACYFVLWTWYLVSGTVSVRVPWEVYFLQWNDILKCVWMCVCDFYMILVSFAFLISFDGLELWGLAVVKFFVEGKLNETCSTTFQGLTEHLVLASFLLLAELYTDFDEGEHLWCLPETSCFELKNLMFFCR